MSIRAICQDKSPHEWNSIRRMQGSGRGWFTGSSGVTHVVQWKVGNWSSAASMSCGAPKDRSGGRLGFGVLRAEHARCDRGREFRRLRRRVRLGRVCVRGEECGQRLGMRVPFVARREIGDGKASFSRLHHADAESTVSYADRACRALPVSGRCVGENDFSSDRALSAPASGTERARGATCSPKAVGR